MTKDQYEKKMALLIVDVQNGVIASAYNKDKVVENINTMISKARASKIPIIWVQHSDNELIKNTKEWEIDSRLDQSSDDYYIDKGFNSSFEKTNLDELIKQLGVNKIVLTGAASNWCIRATAYASLERGYDLCLIGDAHTTESLDFGDGVVIEAKDIILELNTTIQWVEYPDRINETKTADDFEF
ncbi:MAG: isochorismatase family protein [Bacillota bacterium]|nr:isochorismatase family protein [Bacillota bacterium]